MSTGETGMIWNLIISFYIIYFLSRFEVEGFDSRCMFLVFSTFTFKCLKRLLVHGKLCFTDVYTEQSKSPQKILGTNINLRAALNNATDPFPGSKSLTNYSVFQFPGYLIVYN